MNTDTNSTSPWHTPLPRPGRGKRPEPYYFVVEGRGWFPDDMLRYDRAWAVTGRNVGGDNAVHMVRSVQNQQRSVIIATWRHELTVARWNSFGWGVIERLAERPSFLPPFEA